MATLTIRNLPSEVQEALKARARTHGCSTEEEVRRVLKAAVAPKGTGFGTQLATIAKEGSHLPSAYISELHNHRPKGQPRHVSFD